MEDADGLSFDFEGGLDAAAPSHNPSSATAAALLAPDGPPSAVPAPAPGEASSAPAAGNLPPGRRSYRQTVCRHWLRGLCMKGDACGFLHQYDKSRMPVCRFFRLYGECREQDCVYKHTNEDIKECNMYKLGFCPNGPDCRYRHAKLPGPPPSVEEVFQKIQQMTSFNHNSTNRFFQNRGTGFNQPIDKPPFVQPTGPPNQDPDIKPSVALESTTNPQQQPAQVHPPQQQPPQQSAGQQQPQQLVNQIQTQNIPNGHPTQNVRTPLPLPQGQSRYFIVKSCNKENLELSVQQGVWATQRSNEAKLNEAFESLENVILIFSINRTRHFQGCAKMTSKIGGFVGGGNWKYAHGTPHYGRNFSVKWLKLGELSFHKTRHLRNPYNENLPVKISRDCQELEPFIGLQLATLLYDEPDSELWSMLVAAESKREEEKVKGVNTEDATENPDIVPFDDNEEEEEEESEEEEDSSGQAAALARGRGRGLLWPPHMPLVHGGRPMLGVRGFPPVMMAPDGFGFGGMGPDGFGGPDLFGPRMFNPYGGPRFSGDLSGLVFPGRPPQPGVFPGGGLGMMMGANPGPFMGGMMPGGNALRGNRPMGMQPFRMPPPPPPPAGNRPFKKDQRRSDRYETSHDQGSRSQEMAGQDDEKRYHQGSRSQYDDPSGSGYNYQNDESESEDEAPRRSRRRGSHAEAPDR